MITNRFIKVNSIDDLYLEIKNKMSDVDMYIYLSKFINESNFDRMCYFLQESNLPKTDSKYVDALLFLLCSEAITLCELKDYYDGLTKSRNETIKNIDMLLAIELGYVSISGVTINRDKKIIDHIPSVWYGRKDILSYKNINNIADETWRLLKDFYNINKDTKTETYLDENGNICYNESLEYREIFTFLNSDAAIIPDDDTIASLFIEINNNDPIIKKYIPSVSLILNDNNIDSENVELKSHIKSFSPNKDEYTNIISRYTIDTNEHLKLKNLLENIMQRTINYN